VTDKRGKLAAVISQVTKAAPASPRSPVNEALVGQRLSRRAALDDALGKRVAWDLTLRDLARVLPDDVWLTDLNAHAPTPVDAATASSTPGAAAAPAPNPTAFSIDGYTYSQQSVAALLTRLQLLPMLADVTLGSTSQVTIGSKTLVQFQVTAAVVPTTPVAAT
jgi:Tfp pilus assembly protein PilN